MSVVFAAIGIILILWLVPKWQLSDLQTSETQPASYRLLPDSLKAQAPTSPQSIPPKELRELENELRKTLAQILAGVFVLIGLYFGWRRIEVAQEQVVVAQEQVGVAREEQITERFTRAVEQLGNEKLEIRLGGIYALERIAKDSVADHWTIVEVLTAYVRENAPVIPRRTSEEAPGEAAASPEESDPERDVLARPRTDIQAILTVLGRRPNRETEKEGSHLDLRATDLSEADLSKANLRKADLSGADLSGALHLTKQQIKSAIRNEETKLPNHLDEV